MKFFWQIANYTKLALLIATIFTVFIYTSCKEKDDDGTTYSDDLIASFQYDISANNTFQVAFSNYSQKAISYSWNFGDGNTSTEENPTHIYAAGGEYEVVLTVMNEVDESNSKTRVVSITDPDLQLKLLTGDVSKTWYLQREGIALGIGTGLDNTIHWSLGGVAPLGDRPCVLDDKYTFHKDGTFEFNSNNSLYIDDIANGGWINGNNGGCFDENAQNFTASTGEDLSVFGNGGDYTFDYNQAESTLTINGEGAYIGLVNKTSAGNSYIPITTKKYTVFRLAEGEVADTLKIALEPTNGADFWNFYLVSYKNEADLPSLPSAMPLANFGFTNDGNTYTFTNNSSNAVSYSWDFGDGSTSTEINPVHTYSGEGEYTVTLTVQDDMGNVASTTQTIIISSAVFTAFKLSSEEGKVWKLSGDAAYYVGPTSGSSEWWSMDASATADRGCQTNDEFIFFNNGDFNYDTKGDVFADDFVCGSASCISEDDLIAPFDAFASGNHTFEVIGEGDNAKVKVIGTGAFFGFNKGSNGAEIDCGLGNLPDEITYDVIGYTSIAGKETITISVEFITADNTIGWWTMVVESIE